jgi:hypothetical protein
LAAAAAFARMIGFSSSLRAFSRAERAEPVGWVGPLRETHHRAARGEVMGFARGSTHPTSCDEIDALCKLNSIPFNTTGEMIRDGGLWCVYEFTWQLRRNPVLGQVRRALAAWKRISLSRTAKGFTADEAP